MPDSANTSSGASCDAELCCHFAGRFGCGHRLVKADKRQREVTQSLSQWEMLEMLLVQLSRRALCADLLLESFAIQQQLHQAIARLPQQTTSLKPVQQRNLDRLMSRMSWWQLMRFAKTIPDIDHVLIDDVERQMGCLRKGVLPEEGLNGSSFWL